MASGHGKGEKILVSVRVRPRNEKEKTRNDICDWECINNTTIICNNNLPERSLFPSIYTFDKVFGFDSPTKQVYEDGAKEVALCVLDGINSSIFAYGQTSSGKTYTMSGITEFAMDDIFGYIEKHKEREFTLKFSAIEIYNEAVRDLLSGDNNPLRLLDDPERGTVVEKLIEETLRDRTHLEELLSVCETQRKIGETSLNETSSRSHQILRLTIESSVREYSPENSSTLAASVCFVDLAGSERASQTLSAGKRLKEGCHINRSLLTLGTVIRKLRFDQLDVAQSRVENLLKVTAEERSSRMDEHSMLSSMDFDADLRRRSYDSIDVGEPSIINNLTERKFEFLDNSEEDDFLLDDNTPQFSRHNLYDGWEEMVQMTDQNLEDACKEVRCIETEDEQSRGQAVTVESHDLLDDIVDKKAVSEVPSSRNEETLSAPEYEEGYHSVMGYEKAENEDMEISTRAMENVDLSLKTIGVELYLAAKPETYELALKNSDLEMIPPSVEAQEIQESVKEDEQVKKAEKKTSPSTVQAEQYSNKEEKAQSEQILKEDWELNSLPLKQSEKIVAVELLPDGAKLDEDGTSGEKWDNKLPEDADKNCNESSISKDIGADDVDNNTYEALKEKVKEMQKKIEYLMSMHTAEQQQSPSFRRDYKSPDFFTTKRSRSCRENLLSVRSPHWLENFESNNNTSPSWRVMEFKASPGGPISKTSNTSSISFDSGSSTSIDTQSLKDCEPETGNSFHEFVAGLEEMAKQHHSIESTPDLDYPISYDPTRTEIMETRPQSPANSISVNANGVQNHQNRTENTSNGSNDQSESGQGDDLEEDAEPKETDSTGACLEKLGGASGQYSSSSSDFERQQRQIIELWAVCNVPLVHRTYFFLLFKGDPSDYVYMEVELRRLSFLKQTITNDPETSRIQTVKALTREKEWLSKQIPKKFPWNQRIELYQKWGVEVNSKQRSLQVAHKLWTNALDMKHIKESASLVAKLLGFVEPSRMPKEMFGLSLLPRTETVKSSGWRFTKSFSGIRLTG
ncbi:kinesin-like protein KIN-7J [Eutrema salsugineum]|uniref:kinesin-like protein KIN-7J n=1 Tax=Eutrema salsugineum TaxID=72664 RepID=UPI000CED621B|nr:kinesin-like protein KIN-7J [Eutrema salsugineum]